MYDIPTLIHDLLLQFGSVDIAESEFKRMVNEDDELKNEFKRWCEEFGYKERNAFRNYCQDYIQDHESIFDTLSEYNE